MRGPLRRLVACVWAIVMVLSPSAPTWGQSIVVVGTVEGKPKEED